jgi:hypothetical protein
MIQRCSTSSLSVSLKRVKQVICHVPIIDIYRPTPTFDYIEVSRDRQQQSVNIGADNVQPLAKLYHTLTGMAIFIKVLASA